MKCKKLRYGLSCIFFLMGILLLSPAIATPPALAPPCAMASPPPASSPPHPQVEAAGYPTDKLFVTACRDSYKDGEMTLSVPRLNLQAAVLDGVDAETLKRGVGLYDYSPLPIAGNANISIAAHRDLYGCEFYFLDTLAEGDLLYLEYDGCRYTYSFAGAKIVSPEDWSPIYCTEESTLTLTSCTPIGTAAQRIAVRGKLVDISYAADEKTTQ
ncbi:MAG: class E sortase [Angelakisella sp.]